MRGEPGMSNVKEKIWSKYFGLIMVAAMFTSMCMSMLDSTLSLYASDMWASNQMGGYLTSFFNAGSITMAFFSGRIVDRFGRRKCYVIATVVFAIPTFAMALLPYRSVALASRLIQGCAKGLVSVAAASVVSDIIPTSRLGEGMGLYNLSQTLPKALGPVVGIAITATGNYTLMFTMCAVVYLMAGVSAFGVKYESDEKYRAKRARDIELSREAMPETEYRGVWKLIEKKALLASFNYVLYFFSTGVILIFLAVYAREIMLIENSKIGYFFSVSSVTVLVARLLFGRFSDRVSAPVILVPGHVCNIIALVILAFFAVDSYTLFLLAGVFYGIGLATVMPSLNAVAVGDSPKGRNGAANAAFYFLMDMGMLVSSALVGTIIDGAATPAEGYRFSFIMSIAVCTLSCIMSIVCFNNKARARRRAR